MWSEILLLAAARISCGSVSTKAGEHRRFSCLPRIVSVFSNLVQDHIWLNHERVWRGHRLKCSSLPEQSENLLFALYLVGYLNRSLEPKVYFMELLMAVTVFAVTLIYHLLDAIICTWAVDISHSWSAYQGMLACLIFKITRNILKSSLVLYLF